MKKGTFWQSSHYGKRFNTKKNTYEVHGGVDFAAPEGTPVYAAHDGIVSEVSIKTTGFGKSVVIDHNKISQEQELVRTRYAHLSKILVDYNEEVSMGQIIGLVGKTGNTRGKRNAAHLHFELIIDNKKYNPLIHIKKIKQI
jgi:murein DD-endopeptidase MepM/ murein hydrolase activator NlpD